MRRISDVSVTGAGEPRRGATDGIRSRPPGAIRPEQAWRRPREDGWAGGAAQCRRLITFALATLAVSALTGGDALLSAGAVVSAIAVGAAVVGIRRWRPPAAAGWWILVGGAFLFLVGRAVLAFQPVDAGDVAPFPSPADAFFVAGYVFLVVAAAVLVRHRSGGTEDDSLLDGIIVAAAVGVVVAAYFLAPYVSDRDVGGLEKGLTVAYAVADLVLVAVTVRLAVGSGARPPSFYLLAAGLTGIITTDVLTTLYVADKIGRSWAVASSTLCYVFFAGAALHPSMAQLTERPEVRELRLSRKRLALLCGALLLVPGLLAVEIARDGDRGVPVLAVGSVLMAVLILGRLAGLVRSKERKAARERALRGVGAALVAATSREEIQRAALTALAALVSPGGLTRVAIAGAGQSGLTVVGARGARREEAVGAFVAFGDLPPTALGMLAANHMVRLSRTPPLDVPARSEQDVAHVTIVPLSTRGELTGAFLITSSEVLPPEPLLAVETLAGHVSLALESAALTEEIHRRRAERRFRVLVEHSSDLVLVVDERLVISYASPSVSRLLGYEAEDLVGKCALDLIHHDDAGTATRVVGHADQEESPTVAELRFRHATGGWVLLEATVSDLRRDPAVAGIVLNARDVTERRRSEERWRAFGAEASHQLRTPLTGLRLSIENALTDCSPQWRPGLEDALAQVDRLQATVEDFLALAPPRVDSTPPLDVSAVVEDMDATWRGLIEAEGRELVVDIEAPLPTVYSSAAAVRQVLGVLIDNALKHGDGSIRLVAKEVAGGLALEVSDEGKGLSVARNGRTGGKRMGLALARALAEAEGGRLLLRRAGPSPTFALFMPAPDAT